MNRWREERLEDTERGLLQRLEARMERLWTLTARGLEDRGPHGVGKRYNKRFHDEEVSIRHVPRLKDKFNFSG